LTKWNFDNLVIDIVGKTA